MRYPATKSVPRASAIGRARQRGAAALAFVLVLVWSQAAAAACPSCGTTPCTIAGTHSIGSGETCDYTGKDVILTGTLDGDGNAECYTVVADNLTVHGTLRARSSCIEVEVSENFAMEVVGNSAATVDVREVDEWTDGLSVQCGSATLDGKAINANSDGDSSPGGWIRIDCAGDVTGTGGPFQAAGAGGYDGGTIDIYSLAGDVDLASAFDLSGGGEWSFGGWMTIDAAGDVTLGTSSRSLQAQGAQGGSGGTIDVTGGGIVTINGAVNLNGNGEDAYGGQIDVTASAISTGTGWSANGDSGGGGGSIALSALDGTGTITMASNASWSATGNQGGDGGGIDIQAVGDVTLAGDSDVSTNGSGWGGYVDVQTWEIGDVSVSGDLEAGSSGEDTLGGDVTVQADGDVTVASTSRIGADTSGTGATDGSTFFSGCNITVAGTIDSRDGEGGDNWLHYAGTFTQASGSAILADDATMNDDGNHIRCACVDTSPADGVCDSATCASAPVLNGTVTPSADVVPVAMPSCS